MNNQNTFIKAYHYFLSDTRLNPTDKLVYCALLSYQESGLDVFPSNAHLSKTLGVSESSIKRSTKILETLGLISKSRRFNKSNMVKVNTFSPQTGQSDTPDRSNCTLQTGQSDTSRQVNLTSYKNIDKTRNKISLEEKVKSITESKDDSDKSSLCLTNSEEFYLKDENNENDSVIEDDVVTSNRQVPVEPFSFSLGNRVSKLKSQPEPTFSYEDDDCDELPYDEFGDY